VVCRDNDTLVFVEVKTRTREDFGRPLEAVDRAKQKRISRGALAWLRMLENPDILFRFDVIEVIVGDGAQPRVELIRNAFPLSKPYLY
jgi:putative endonuclease